MPVFLSLGAESGRGVEVLLHCGSLAVLKSIFPMVSLMPAFLSLGAESGRGVVLLLHCISLTVLHEVTEVALLVVLTLIVASFAVLFVLSDLATGF